jgi:hypothetical protein
MSAIYALYPNPETAQSAFEALRQASSLLGVDRRKIVVVTPQPYEGYGFADEQAKSPMFALAALGGLVGGLSGIWLTSFTQTSYPLPTGGMPIVTSWTNGIIIYELAMLGAILATLASLLVMARLPRFKGGISDPMIWSGKILVGIEDPPPAVRSELEVVLLRAGALEVKSVPAAGDQP